MTTTTNKTLIFKKIPTTLPVPGEHLAVEDRPFDKDAAPPSGGITVQLLWASFDPYLRGKMRDASIKSYSPAFEPGAPITNAAVARVLKSDRAGLEAGDLVVANLPVAQFARLEANAAQAARKIENPRGLPLEDFLGPLGMPGLTAYASLHAIGKPQSGETIFISSAAGAVGQVVGQVAKREGLKVIGSVGSDAKLDFVTKELGFDGAFNYKKEKPLEALARLAPKGIDIYFENVGGEHLDAALRHMNTHGRIIACGMISQYNKVPGETYGVKNLGLVVSKRIKIEGFIVGDEGFGPTYAQEHQKNLQQWLAEGSIKAKFNVTDGIDNAAEGFVGMLQGKNFGKAVLKI